MPATSQPTLRSQRQQLVLVLSHDPLAAALLGGLVETLGYVVQFRRPPESAEDSFRRSRARICLIDSADPSMRREDFLRRTLMRGVCVIIFGTHEALERVRGLAAEHQIETLLMPPAVEELEAILQRAAIG